MSNIRIIPRLDIKGPNLVKGIQLEGLRVLGKPENFAKFYYENGADELIFQDVVASLYERNSLKDVISKASKSIFIPITIGGGLRTLEDINDVLRAGADKVSINTAAIRNPKFITEASRKFGSSTIVAAVEAIKQPNGQYLAFTDNGREETGIEVVQWVQRLQELGAGEILLTSVDREGSGKGLDRDLISQVAKSIEVPLIVHGGAGKKEDLAKDLKELHIDGLALSSILHYYVVNNKLVDLSGYQAEGNTSFVQSGSNIKTIPGIHLKDLKNYFAESGLDIRNL